MCSLLAAYEEAAFYFPCFIGKATEAYRDKQLAQVQVDCEWRCWSFSPRWCNSRDLFLAITSVQLGSSSGDPNTFSVLLIWVSHQKPQNYLWFLLPSILISGWFLQTPGVLVCPPHSLIPLLLPEQMPFYLENAQRPICHSSSDPLLSTRLTQADWRWWTVSTSSWQTREDVTFVYFTSLNLHSPSAFSPHVHCAKIVFSFSILPKVFLYLSFHIHAWNFHPPWKNDYVF